MNKNQVSGRVEEAKGTVKEAVGKVLGNERLQAEGMVQKHVGKTEKNVGDAREQVKDAAKEAAGKL